MADVAVLSSHSALRVRNPLVELDHNIVHVSKQIDGKTNFEPQHSVALNSLPISDNGQEPAASAAAAINLNATHLISSPYPDLANQLHLEHLEKPFQLFAFALTTLRPIRKDYATAPYLESFNWPEVFALLRFLCKQSGFQWNELGVYVVIFRSRLLKEADRGRLGILDQKSHEEACASGGLLKYWFGSIDEERRNLATCLWRHREDASLGGGGPWHAKVS